MVGRLFDIGIDQIDGVLGGGLPPGSVLTIIGSPGPGSLDISLRYLSRGFEKGENGLFVSFTSLPFSSILKTRANKLSYQALLNTEDPILMKTTDLQGLELLLGLIDEGEVKRMVLERPDVLSMREERSWFKVLEDVLERARKMDIGTIVMGGNEYMDHGDLTSEGLIKVFNDEVNRICFRTIKWPYSGGGKVVESEAGIWVR